MSADPSRLSFAKVYSARNISSSVMKPCKHKSSQLMVPVSTQVAASAGKDNVALSSFAKVATSTSLRDQPRKENVRLPTQNEGVGGSSVPIAISEDSTTMISNKDCTQDDPSSNMQAEEPHSIESSTSEAKLVDAVQALSVNSPMPSLVVNGSGLVASRSKADTVEGFSEDPFQRTDSGSELGTKPPSLDGKSITSGTTFALDEKESLRPDDSASVKAAEDDDTFSGRGSIVAGSRIGSEAAGRAYRAQFYEVPDRRSMQPMQERQSQGISTPHSGSSGQQTTDDGKPKPLIGATGTPEAFNLFYRQTPDEKLLEALESPKDRIFLLRLEQDVIEFVKDSK
jgi:hypothetical protein